MKYRIIKGLTTFLLVMAFFTGNQKTGSSMTGKLAVKCQYQYAGRKFWRTFKGGICPQSVEIE